MIGFYCTRCGTRLEIEPEHAGSLVRCEQCSAVVRTPERVPDDIPFARVAEPIPVHAIPAAPLSYVPAWPERYERSLALDALAERLSHVEADDAPDGEGMTQCSHCGSTIAGFVRKCPFCRRALWGV